MITSVASRCDATLLAADSHLHRIARVVGVPLDGDDP